MLESFRKYWHGDQDELVLLLDLRDEDAPRRERIAAAGAVAAQFVVIAVLFYIPMGGGTSGRFFPEVRVEMGQPTPVFVPRDVIENFKLTQKAPQTTAPATEVNLEKLLPRTGRETSPAPGPPAARAKAKPFIPPEPERTPVARLEPPRIEAPQRGETPEPPVPAPELPPPAPPKLVLERVGPAPGSPGGAPVGPPKIFPPSSRPEQAARELLRSGSGGRLSVNETDAAGSGGTIEMLRQSPTPGRPGSALELLSDPQGVDFKPYLIQVLALVRRNWMAVMPESVRFGQRGRTVVQFAIDRNGRIPKVAIVMPSGSQGLDRAAVAGLTASVPFPPLPAEFRGSEIRLQFVFSYNMPAR